MSFNRLIRSNLKESDIRFLVAGDVVVNVHVSQVRGQEIHAYRCISYGVSDQQLLLSNLQKCEFLVRAAP